MKRQKFTKGLWRVVLLMLPMAAFAQPPDSLWSRTFGGSNGEACESVWQTSDGGYIMAGLTYSFGAGNSDFWLVKTNADGHGLWSRTFGGASYDYCFSVQQTPDGGYILAGYTESFGAGGTDFWLVKTNANGDSLWSRTFGGASNEQCRSFQQTSEGGYILAGYTYSFGSGLTDFYLVCTDANGNQLWSRTFGTGGYEECESVQQTSDGGYILGGLTGVSSWDFWLVKTNANGDSVWSRTFGGSGGDQCESVQQTSDGGYILGGMTTSFGAGVGDVWLVKTDANGNQLWSRTFGGSYWDGCESILETPDGGYILGGFNDSFGSGNRDAWLIKVSAYGDSLWSRTFGGYNVDACRSVQRTADGGYILGGSTSSYGSGADDFWLVKTGAESPAEPVSISLPVEFSLYQNYPNPFNASTQIAYDLPKAGIVSLRVFDLLGREVGTLAGGMQPAGSHFVPFDGSGFASGVYLCRLQAGDFSATRKMVLLK
ncbi:MAG: T9SS type A sorting domain-containing protein [bacterium]